MKLTEMIKLGAKGFKPADIKELEGSGVQTEDVIKLAENGYSVADVKELITLAGSEEEVQPGNKEHDGDDPGPGQPSGNDGEDKVDYKAEFEKQRSEAEELKKKIAQMQLKNSQKNLGSGEPDDDPRKAVQEALKQLY